MPLYALVSEDGERLELQMSIAEFQSRSKRGYIRHKGKKYRTDWQALTASSCPSIWPMAFEQLAVDPRDVPKAMAEDKKHGVSCDHYDKDGCPVFSSRRQLRDYARAYGYKSWNGGYSSP